jgi:NAD(P)-dependent dehydrogenase (short-subunit alcohol dehydrogenase family)
MEQKVILITGASSGFGKAMAEKLAAAGHIVYGASRRAAQGINGLKPLQMDVTSRQQAEAAVAQILQKEKQLDILINNAGMGIGGAAELATEEEIETQINTNFFGVVNLCSAVLPHFREKRKGLIINISSIGGVFAVPYQGFYSASKFAVEGYSEALSLETAQFGIKVVIVEPGDFNTGFTANRVISQKTLENSDYQKSFERVLKNIEKDETNGGKPEYLVNKIVEIINSERPKLRYIVTPNLLQKLSVLLSHLLCGRLFQRIIRLFYNV